MSRSSIEFPLAKTINDENEFAIKFTGLYVTKQEALIIAASTIASYPLANLVLPNSAASSLIALFIMLLCAWATASAINTLRKGKPPSYIWDMRYRYGMIAEQRCWMRCSIRRPRILLRYHKCSPHVFLGGNAAKELLSVDQEWRRLMPPGGVGERPLLEWPRLVLGRKRLIIEEDLKAVDPETPNFVTEAERRTWETTIRPIEGGYPAPIWFYAPLGFDQSANHLGHRKVLHITLPLQRSYRE